MRWTLGRPARAAAIGAILLAGGLMTAGSAAADVDADLRVTYSCGGFPSGTAPVTVRVHAAFPTTVTSGRPIQPSKVSVAATLPASVVADLNKLNAATVLAAVKLTLGVSQAGTSLPTDWSLAARPLSVPASGDATLAATGKVPPVAVGNGSEVAFSADALGLELTLVKADGSPTSPAVLPITCIPRGASRLANLPVTGPGSAPGSTVGASPGGTGPGGGRPVTPKAEGIPDHCGDIPPVHPGGTLQGCVYITGFSNINKLNGATIINDPSIAGNPVAANIAVDQAPQPVIIDGKPFLRVANKIRFISPFRARATFLTFGFMPTTASMEFSQEGTGDAIALNSLDNQFVLDSTTLMGLHLFDVKVNGRPLDVGPNCRTERPLEVKLHGASPEINSIFHGGPLRSQEPHLTIPPFTGCGVNEDLNPLFTASVSGPGNYQKVTQGNLCIPTAPPDANNICPPAIPPLQR